MPTALAQLLTGVITGLAFRFRKISLKRTLISVVEFGLSASRSFLLDVEQQQGFAA